nr:disease resistance protein RML1B-like [Ziziphus jujuba var. spinosa]
MENGASVEAALTEASNLCGLDSKDFRPENKLVQKSLKTFIQLPKYLSFNEQLKGHLIGIEKHIKEIESRLSLVKDVRIIGIWGMEVLATIFFGMLGKNIQDTGKSFEKELLSELLNDESILRMDTPFVASLLLMTNSVVKSSPPKNYAMLSNNVISYADGNPLALKVLGSFLHSKSTDEWESALNKLKRIPNKDILDVLRISYEGLDKGEQNLS